MINTQIKLLYITKIKMYKPRLNKIYIKTFKCTCSFVWSVIALV